MVNPASSRFAKSFESSNERLCLVGAGVQVMTVVVDLVVSSTGEAKAKVVIVGVTVIVWEREAVSVRGSRGLRDVLTVLLLTLSVSAKRR